jgi:hypothetical protein
MSLLATIVSEDRMAVNARRGGCSGNHRDIATAEDGELAQASGRNP